MLKWALCGTLFVLCSHIAPAQRATKEKEEFLFNSALDFIEFQDYESAHSLLLQLDSLKPNNDKYTFNIGVCLFRSLDKVKSLYYFLKARQLGYSANPINYYLGLAYRYNYDLDNASYYLHQYLSSLSELEEGYEVSKREAVELINQIESSKEILARRLSVGVHNLGGTINSEAADYVPLLLSKDSVIIFTSRRKGSTGGRISHDGWHYEDIYTAKKNKTGEWERVSHFPGFNGKHHDANVAINKAENELYIFKANGHGNIYVSKKNNHERWLRPKPLKRINSSYWEGSICLSPKEDTIYFSSDRPHGYGGSDLYFAVKDKNGEWADIQNLGPSINTPSDEDSPYMYKDGKTFFFSSKGHNSIGGYDIFSARKTNTGWREIKNIGFPINTVDDDIYFQLNSEASFGYFTSFRHSNFSESSIGEKDLFEITRPNSSPVFFVFKGLIYDAQSKDAIPAIVSLKDLTDSTKTEQKLITDINSGKFRYDLKFENHYKLTVEVGDKVYFSKELYFPYQPDLFETFLDIPLKDIPSFDLKLHDVIEMEKDAKTNVMLDQSKTPTLVLVRKIGPNDADLNSLFRKKIPMSFRRRLMDQLKNTAFVDNNADDLMQEIHDEAKIMDSIYSQGNAIMKKLSIEDKTNVERIALLNSLKNTSTRDSIAFQNISGLEKRIIRRISDYVLGKDSANEKTIDKFLINSLKPEEVNRVMQLVAQQLKKQGSFNDDTVALSKFDQVMTEKSKQERVKRRQGEAWGILYTIEASHYKYLEQEQLNFKGLVTHRSNNKQVPNLKLLLTDDRGMIYDQASTNTRGEITFSNLASGKRYHILVDDYMIALLGRSRYEMRVPSVQSSQQDYLKFYYGLSPDERRMVDRIIADSLLKDNYQQYEIHKWQDESEYEKLAGEEKKMIGEVAAYLSASSPSNIDFFMKENAAYLYEHTNAQSREMINRLISRRVKRNKPDSAFYQSLSDREKDFILQLKENRKAKKVIVEDVLLSREDSDFWYMIDEVNTKIIGNQKAVSISGMLTKELKPAGNFQIALLDEFNQLVHVEHTDSSGNFKMLWVTPGKKYKVVISNGGNISEIIDYELNGMKIEADTEDFYASLTLEEKRTVDRFMATTTANESYQLDSALWKADRVKYQSLTSEQKDFIERLRKHLFAEEVTLENAFLKNIDNHYYYSLSPEQRNFINRSIISVHHNPLNTTSITLHDHDSMFYEKLTQNQKLFIENLRKHRRARADIFAESPALIADTFWVLLDSVSKPINWARPRLSFTGQLVDKISSQPIEGITVMVADGENKFIGQVVTDSLGNFRFSDLPSKYKYRLLAENRRIFFSEKFNYEIRNLGVTSEQTDSLITGSSAFLELTVYFDFDSYALKKEEKEKLLRWSSSFNGLGSNSELKIEGHADSTGSSEYNQVLSEKRAATINDFFFKMGYSQERLSTNSFGEMQLRYHGNNAGLNRRVEIIVMGSGE